jgi:predicted GNAT superfamily acetyltransferase
MSLVIRDFKGLADFRAAEAMQKAVWGDDDIIDPADLMMVIAEEGGLAAGAFDEGRLLGYIFAFPTATAGVQHSHRLAVLEEARGLGLGAKLKWYQADWCAARGISLVRWTFDPLRFVNAMLNIEKLGASVTTYFTDYYGEMGGINAGTASDRLLADWRLSSARVERRRHDQPVMAPEVIATAERVAIPRDFGRLVVTDHAAAEDARVTVRTRLIEAFGRGLAVAGVDGRTAEYLLVPARRLD